MGSRPFTTQRLENLLNRPRVFLRHDVDSSIPAARLMAELEQDLEIRATYFLLTDSPFYSPTEAYWFSVELAEMGHKLGWHVDPRHVDLQTLGETSIRMPISLHCPRPYELWTRFPGVQSAYDPIWEGRYYADSRGRFAHGDPEDHLTGDTIQINLHPEWWFTPTWHETVDDQIYEEFFHEPKELLRA